MQCLSCYMGEMVKPQDGHPSYLVCENCNAIELRYKPADYQIGVHTVSYSYDSRGHIRPQIIGVFGGYGSGKSRASLQEFFMRALENPNGTGLITAPTLQLLKRTSIKALLEEIIPPPLIENYNKTDNEIRLVNGFTIYAIPSDDDTKLRSINAGQCHIEEASGIKRSIFDQLLSRLRDPFVKNKAIFVCSNPELSWIKDVLVDNEKRKNPKHPEHEDYNPYITVFIWPTHLNPHLPEDFIAMNSKGHPEWWVRKYLQGSFEASEGAVYPRFAGSVVAPFEIPKDWERVIGMDHGSRNPTAIVFGAIDPVKGILYIYQEYYKPNTLVPDHAKALKPLLDEIPHGRLRFMVGDPSIKNKTDFQTGKSVQGLYQEYGIYWSLGNNNIEAGILKVNSYIERGRLKVFDTCPNVIREHLHYKFPEITMDNDKNLDEKPEKKNEHSCFVAGTMVTTEHGDIPIEQIQIGTKVLTRLGYAPVVDWAITGLNEQVYDVYFSDGKHFTATGNHPVWIDGKGFTTVDSLRYGDIITVKEELTWLNQSNGMESLGDGIQSQKTLQHNDTTVHGLKEKVYQNTYTERSIEQILVKYPKVITFITKMGMRGIMTRRIWKRCPHSITCHTTERSKNRIGSILPKFKKWQRNGIAQRKATNGIANTLMSRLSKPFKNATEYVNTVAMNLRINQLSIKQGFVPTTANLLGAGSLDLMTNQGNALFAETSLLSTNTQQQRPVQKNARYVVGVKPSMEKATVYNITVADAHEYFANGVLVSNCDALRYLCMRLPDNPDMLNSMAYEAPTRYNRNVDDEFEYNDYNGKSWLEYA